jgi:H+-translocating NAD(P) transhydrogenase subunit beta
MSSFANGILVPLLYLVSSVLFIFGLKGLTRVRSARNGNGLAALGMLLAIVGVLIELGVADYRWILLGSLVGGLIGAVVAVRVPMTSMPEMVALLNGCGGAASALVGLSLLWLDVIELSKLGRLADLVGHDVAITTGLSVLIGGVTTSGSLVAYLKLKGTMSGQPILLPGRHWTNAVILLGLLALVGALAYGTTTPGGLEIVALAILTVSLVLGVTLVIPIGGADMPVVISLLNSYSGLAAAATGFVLHNNLLIITGALVGASGIILSHVMCVAMNRTLGNVLFGGFGATATTSSGKGEYENVRAYSAEECAMVLESAESVIIVPGYGLAVAQAQHTCRELGDMLEKRGAKVTYAIHPVAGRMPGHMNVLLAEADVPYEKLLEMDVVNPEFSNTDVVIVVGANDVVNPAAKLDPTSPIAGMPVLEVWSARSVIMIKRSLSAGFAGLKNPLFENPNTMMLFEDAKKGLQAILTELKSAH